MPTPKLTVINTNSGALVVLHDMEPLAGDPARLADWREAREELMRMGFGVLRFTHALEIRAVESPTPHRP